MYVHVAAHILETRKRSRHRRHLIRIVNVVVSIVPNEHRERIVHRREIVRTVQVESVGANAKKLWKSPVERSCLTWNVCVPAATRQVKDIRLV